MMKNKIAAFFDAAAENWDNSNLPDPGILGMIAFVAGAGENKTVLDAGCGTGVMLPVYLSAGVRQVTAVDISPEMLRIAREKYPSEKLRFVCGDITTFGGEELFDCVVAHNAFPHFLPQERALARLSALTAPGGTLTIAHSVSRERVLRCHEKLPVHSAELPEAGELAAMFGGGFTDFTIISDEEKYIVSATKK